jgi:predicted MFS family arabinose efflux permease
MSKKTNPILILSASIFIAMLGLGITDPILPIYAQDLGATLAQIGLLTSAFSISRFVFAIPIGQYSDRTSKKRVITTGLLVYTIVSIFYAFSWDFTSLISIRFIHGIGSAMFMPMVMAYGADISPAGKEGQYMGTINLAMMAGVGIGPFLGGVLTELFSKNAVFYAMASFTGISLLLTVFLLPITEKKSNIGKVSISDRQILANKTIISLAIFNLIIFIGMTGVYSFLSIYLLSPTSAGGPGLSFSSIGAILSVGMIISSLLQGEYGKLADRYDKSILIIASGLLGACGIMLFPFMSNTTGFMIAQIIFVGGVTLGMPAIRALAAIEGKELGTGTVMSVLQISESAGNIIGPLIAGIAADLIGLQDLFYLGGLIMILGVLLYYLTHNRTRTRSQL